MDWRWKRHWLFRAAENGSNVDQTSRVLFGRPYGHLPICEKKIGFSGMISNFLPESFSLVVIVFVLAGLIKGVVGMGLPTVSMALLVLFMAPAQAAALLIIPSLVTNLWQAGPSRTLVPLLRRVGGMQLGVGVGTLVGALLLGAPSGKSASVALGGALMVYAGWALFGTQLTVPARSEKWLGPPIGALTGLITAGTGVFVVPAVPYLQALAFDRDDLVQVMGISFSISTVALAAGLWINDSYSAGAIGASLVMLIPALAGMYAGQSLRKSLSPKAFRTCFLASLMVLGIYLVIERFVL
jgi:uncharacterized protein